MVKLMIEGSWTENDIRRAFVAGAKWWEYHQTGATMWQSDQRLAEEEAERKYGDIAAEFARLRQIEQAARGVLADIRRYIAAGPEWEYLTDNEAACDHIDGLAAALERE